MERNFVFRGQECCYDYYWLDDTFYFCFNSSNDKDFVDEDGDEYFIRCQYCRGNEDNELCSPWYFERWYEHDCVNACDYFDDRLTEEELKNIKEFMLMLMYYALN